MIVDNDALVRALESGRLSGAGLDVVEGEPNPPAALTSRADVIVTPHVAFASASSVAELRTRMNLIGSVPALQASAAPHYDAWERAVGEFAATRLGLPADSLYPLAIGRTTLAASRAAFDRWVACADNDLTVYLHHALAALGNGFAVDTSGATSCRVATDKDAEVLSRDVRTAG